MKVREHKSGYVYKRVKCDPCGKKFNKKENFKKHLDEVHKGIENNTQESTSNIQENRKDESMKLTFPRELRSNKKKESANVSKSIEKDSQGRNMY